MRKRVISLLLSVFVLNVNAQNSYLFNKQWQFVNPNYSGQYDFLVSAVSANGNLIYIANSKNTSNNSDIVLACISPFGSVSWQTNCGSDLSTDDYGTCVKTDTANNIYISASKSNGTDTDYYIAKYSSNGTLIWQYTFSGTGTGNDYPTDLVVDPSGNVYVTGTCYNSISQNDIGTIKLNSGGSLIWQDSYDFNGFLDGGSRISINNAGDIIVCGSSQDTLINSEFTVLKYNPNGVLLASTRHTTSGQGLDYPTAMQIDSNDDIFVTGTCDSLGNKSIKTISLDNGLNSNWFVKEDRYGGMDEGYDLKLMGSTNLYVTGYSTRVSGAVELNVFNYNPTNGAIKWVYQREPETNNSLTKGHKILIRQNGDIFIAGQAGLVNNASQALLLGLDSSGTMLFERSFAMQNNLSYANNLNDDNDLIYLSGYTQALAGKQIAHLKLSFMPKNMTAVITNTIATAGYIQNQLIFRIKPDQLKMNTINNTDIVFGKVSDFIDSTLLTELSDHFGSLFDEVTAIKIFPDLTSYDSISISRRNETVLKPKFWSDLLFEFPGGTNLKVVSDTIKKYLRHKIYRTEANWIATLSGIDPLYAVNSSLKPTTQYPLSHIDIGPAWALETGKPNIRVGVYDSKIQWSHEDFGNGTFAGSVVKGGYDYVSNAPIFAGSIDSTGHGTQCAGIIGAIRNNSKGLAGIAGGNDSLNQPGISLYSMKTFMSNSIQSSVADLYTAIVDGATSINNNNPKYLGLHIMNCSWGVNPAGGSSSLVADTNSTILRDAVRYAYKNHVVSLYARGNANLSTAPGIGTISTKYPTTLVPDDWLISVGAIDAAGQNNYPGNLAGYSDYGNKMDLVTPGSGFQYTTTSIPNNNSYFGGSQLYGTSFACPHAAGVAALMCSYLNLSNNNSINLAPEDVEQLMERWAYKYPSIPLYNKTANGLLKAGTIFSVITKPSFAVEHYTAQFQANLASLQNSNINITLNNDYPVLGITEGSYQADVYHIVQATNHNPSLPGLLGFWTRNSSSTPAGPIVSGAIDLESNISLTNVTMTGAVVSGYIYHFTFKNTQNQAMNFWYPCDTTGIVDLAYTLHTTNVPLFVDEKSERNGNYLIYPNPTNNKLFIHQRYSNKTKVKLNVYDNLGRMFQQITLDNNGESDAEISTIEWPVGIYLLSLQEPDGREYTFKVIKND